MSAVNKTLVLGVGNTARTDDGVGPKVIHLLRGTVPLNTKGDCPHKALDGVGFNGDCPPKFPPCVDLLDGGTDGLVLLDVIGAYDRAIIIDAVNMNAAPGTIRVFSPKEAKIQIKHDALSTHGIGLAEVLQLMEQLEIKTDVTIIGVQPESLEFSEVLSETVQKKLKTIIEKTREIL